MVQWVLRNVWEVLRFSYELAEIFWRFPNEFVMIWMRCQCKIFKVRNQPVQGRIDWQYGQLRHHILGYLPHVSPNNVRHLKLKNLSANFCFCSTE